MTNTPEQILTPEFFIRYFERIPDSKWCTGLFDNGAGQHCALGHCGVTEREFGTMGEALEDLFRNHFGHGPIIVNDGLAGFPQPTPKLRILEALRRIQSKQDQRAQLAYHQKLLVEAEQTPPKPAPPAPPLQITSGWPSVTLAQPATVREVV